jgi:hypothetical protein
MIISYNYQNKTHRLIVNWTSEEGKSTVFHDITERAAARHGIKSDEYLEIAKHLDELTDKLYLQLHIFIEDYYSIPLAALSQADFATAM